MKKAFIWNIIFVKTQQVIHRLQMINRHHKFFLITLMEPFQQTRHIQKYRKKLGMAQAGGNFNVKSGVLSMKTLMWKSLRTQNNSLLWDCSLGSIINIVTFLQYMLHLDYLEEILIFLNKEKKLEGFPVELKNVKNLPLA